MTPRFPPLAAPAAPLVSVRRTAMVHLMPRWLDCLPLAELLVLGTIGAVLAMA